MRFIVIGTWEPHRRNEYAKRRMEKGRMAPKGMKVLCEWLDVSGGRQLVLIEADSALECFQLATKWNDIARFECFPVVEVKDDKMTQIS